jgi:hypothetical protein
MLTLPGYLSRVQYTLMVAGGGHAIGKEVIDPVEGPEPAQIKIIHLFVRRFVTPFHTVAASRALMASPVWPLRKFRSSRPSIFMCPMVALIADLRFSSRFICGVKPRLCPDSMIEASPSNRDHDSPCRRRPAPAQRRSCPPPGPGRGHHRGCRRKPWPLERIHLILVHSRMQ